MTKEQVTNCQLTVQGAPADCVTDRRGNVYFTIVLAPGFWIARLECHADQYDSSTLFEDNPWDDGATRIGPIDFSTGADDLEPAIRAPTPRPARATTRLRSVRWRRRLSRRRLGAGDDRVPRGRGRL